MPAWPCVPAEGLLAVLYDAVLDAQGFQGFLDMLVPQLRLKAAAMIVRSRRTEEVRGLWLSGMDLRWVESYALDYGGEDMLAAHLKTAPIAQFYASNLDVAEQERLPQTRFYSQWLVPQGVAYAAAAIVQQEGEWLTEVYLQRADAHGAFTRQEMAEFNCLLPHLQRAMHLRQRLSAIQTDGHVMAGGLDVWAMPTLLFDEYGSVALCNRSAAALLGQKQEAWLENGHLRIRDLAAGRALGVEIGKALRASRGTVGDAGTAVSLKRHGRLPLILVLAPLRSGAGGRLHGGALLFVFDPEAAPGVTPDTVRGLFGLSDAEAQVAVALCCGKTLDDVAVARGTTINTVKSQLRSTFHKTGTARQSELVSLLLASPACFLASRPQLE